MLSTVLSSVHSLFKPQRNGDEMSLEAEMGLPSR